MVRKIMQWIPIEGTRWRNEVANDHGNHEVGFAYAVGPDGSVMAPLANYQIALHSVVCAGALMVVLALFFIKHEIER